MRYLKRRTQFSSLFWLFVGLGFAWGGIRYGFGSWREPGAGFLPIVFGMLLAVLSIFLFMMSLMRDPDNQKETFLAERGKPDPHRPHLSLFGGVHGVA